MPAPKGNRNAVGNKGGPGAETKYRPEYAAAARDACLVGATDADLAEMFEVDESTLNRWKRQFVEFSQALKDGKDVADAAVARSLYEKALDGDTTACIFWLKNRKSKVWRDRHEHTGPDGGPFRLSISSTDAEL